MTEKVNKRFKQLLLLELKDAGYDVSVISDETLLTIADRIDFDVNFTGVDYWAGYYCGLKKKDEK